MILINEHTERVDYLSQTYCGKTHDKKIADREAIQYPPHATLDQDSGFQGYAPPGVLTFQPKKKPRGQDLGVADLFFNRLISSVRIRVEHVIASVKRCRIVKDVLRNTKDGFSDLVMRVACALHNWRISFRHPTPSWQLLVGYFRKSIEQQWSTTYAERFPYESPLRGYAESYLHRHHANRIAQNG